MRNHVPKTTSASGRLRRELLGDDAADGHVAAMGVEQEEAAEAVAGCGVD